MNRTKPIQSFQRKQISVKKNFSPNCNFSFVSSVLCSLTDNFVVQKSFSRKKFSEKLLLLKNNFLLLLSFLSTPLISYTKLSKNLIILKVNLCWKKKEVLNMIFHFCLRSSVPPLIRGTFKKTFLEKNFSWTTIFLKNKFITLFLSNLFDIFYQTIQNTFSWKPFSITRKKFSKNCFSFFSIGTLYSHW